VLGDTVNVAARLRAKAPPGTVRVDEATAREAGAECAFGPAVPLALKGKSRPVPARDALAMRTRSAARSLVAPDAACPPLIGRDAPLARLRAAAARAAGGRGGVLLMTGEEGSGRSRLLAALAQAPEGAALDTFAVRPALDDGAAAGGAAAELLAELSPDGVGVPGPEIGAALRAAVAGRERPLLLALEDVDRLDPASLAHFAALLPLVRERPLLLAITAPPTAAGASAGLPALARSLGEACEEIALAPLDGDAAGRLVDALAGDAPLAPPARALLLERAAGHPGRLVLGVHLAPALAAERAHEARRAERSSDAERRRATILFADITGFTAMTEQLGAEAAYPIVAGCLALLDAVARRHGGHVEKHLGDCVMATFGVPEAIEDAPRAAINAAIEMRARLREYDREHGLDPPLDLHAGIHTGLGIAGDVSGPLLREFAVMGDPVDLAAALTDRAGAGQILVGADTWRLARDTFAFRALDPRERPGRGALPAYELLSDRPRLHRERASAARRVHSPLVGREQELANLRGQLAALRTGRGAVVSLVAEAGLGKSRLVAELAAAPEAAEVAWLEGRSLSTGRSLRFHPFADLLRRWSGIGDEDDDGRARARLAEAVAGIAAEDAEETALLLASLLGLPLADIERSRLERIQGEALEKMIRRAVTRALLGTAAARPLVVVMDDLHWADDSSLELLIALLPLATSHPLLFALVARPGWEATAGRVEAAARAVEGLPVAALSLAALTRPATRALLANLFATDALPHGTRATIEEKAQGNPFFVEEVVRSLMDQGAVEASESGLRATERIHEVAIPDTLHEVVMARVDRLPLRRRTLLQVASVIGRSFHEGVLEAVLGEPVAETLRELAAAEFVGPWDQTRGVEWAFQHPVLHEVTYDSLLETRREELHLRVARAVEAHLPADVPGRAGMLAWHYGKGGALEQAEEHLFRAGEEAARVAAASEALRFFQEASRLYLRLHGKGGDPRKRARLAHQLALALFHRGRLAEADDHFQEALLHLGARPARGPLRAGLGFARDAGAVLARLARPPRLGAGRPASDVDREVIAVMWERAQAQITRSPTRFLFDSIGGLARLGRVDPTSVPGAGGMYAGAVGIFSYGGVSFALGRRCLERAAPLVRRDDVPERLVYRMMNLLHTVLAGDWRAEHAVDDELLEEGLRYGRLWEVTNALNLEGLKRLYRGDWDGGAACAERLARIAEQYQHDLARSAERFLRAMASLERRELPAAAAALAEYLDEHPEPAFQVSALGHLAVSAWLGGDEDGARAALERAERRLREAARLLPYHAADYLRARQLLDVAALERERGAGARRRAARSRRASLRAAARVAWRRPEALRAAGSEAWLAGRTDLARRRWAESLAEAERLGMGPERARTQLEMGRRLAAAGAPEGAGLLRAAGDALRAFGLDAEASAADARRAG